MFTSRKQQEAYPAVPDSLRSDSLEMSELRKTQQARADTSPYITPYLGLSARLSQIWINRWTILLLLVLLRIIILIASLNDNVDEANAKALSACTKVEDIGSAMASMPHYLSVGVNELSAKGIEKTLDGMVAVLGLVITGVQNLIIFVINMMTSMYTCLITAFVHGGLDVASDVTKKVTDAMNKAIGSITDTIDDKAKSLQDGINKAASAIEDSVLGKVLPDFPKVDFTGPVSDLRDIKIDTSGFVSDLNKLNNDLPTFEEVQNMTAEAISFPFNLLKQTVNDAYAGYKFDRSVFPVAQKQALTFCSNNNNISDFFRNLRDKITKARIAFIVVLSILAVLVIAPMAWLEIMRWRRERKTAKIIANGQYDSMDVVYIASRPMTATYGVKIASHFKGKRQIMVRWAIAYATSLPALFVLALAIAGFFSCLCQYIILKAVQKEVPALANQVGNFAGEVVNTLEGVSKEWADDANGVILNTQNEINNDMLGYVTNATSAVNDTLNTFTSTMTLGLETVFNGTILINPIKDVVRCTIGLKVEAVQKGLTWVHDHSQISFPTFDNDTFSLGAQESISGDSDLNTFLASPSSVTTDEVTGAVTHVTDWLERGIIQEALISTGILLIYVIIVLIGVIRALVGMVVPDKGRAEGGLRYTGDDRPAMSPRSPSRSHGNDSRFPQFGSDHSAVDDEHYSRDIRDEKTIKKTSMGRAQPMEGHERSSSYGHFDTASSTKF
ncbi:Plasma membrane fusion protein [Colletotrichum fructicola]|uniref:Plasma membrane fusion protein PRM1 n=2 Tax=Colletotrichum gloeosporioides species complex TaxID=2707338 RepID=L2G1E8_COLFN|nr:Plasma membrane fusion protein [Colletotrichum fructicola]KAF4482553.1 Plasma membrane fusion protein PRM1 [Colletotrichum fructicola Nara gc5]KAI8286310.1 Plasma membrane fusion protein [Colletotrichum sp. SAR11_57]KAK1838595.1 plasma membrane fusion protein prm1 [Colletotrichum chrysophilum]KAE9572213.1 Plasma membrane fusion protein [Colletotrichum fructicola]KAF4413498.1 Plasma membrane fusion protein PRM1 [Colletotrichum fructicola]